MRELVGELHRHPAAERMADDGHPLDVEYGKQVAHPVGIAGDRVVGARFVGAPVTEQIGGDDRESLSELGLHRIPRRGVVTDAVDQQNRRPGPGDPERPLVPVNGAELQRGRGHFAHRAKIGFALPLGHLANLVVGPDQGN